MHSLVSKIVSIGTGTEIWYHIEYLSISGIVSKIKIKCFGSANAQMKPFSIYPIDFKFESNDISIVPLHIIAHPYPDVKIDNEIHTSEVYTVYGELEYTLQDIDKRLGFITLCGYARAMISHVVAPSVFFVIEWN